MNAQTVLHPHNAVLQVWVEFGVLGAVLAALWIVFLMNRIDGQVPLLRHYDTLLFVVMLGVLSMGYGLWQAWQLGFVFSIPAFSILISRLYPEKFIR